MLREKDELTGSVSGEARECESRSQRVRVVLLVLSRECGPRERERERERCIRGDESCKSTIELSKL